MAQLTYFDYITGITIGSIAGSLVVERSVHLLDSIFGFVFWATFAILLNLLSIKSRKARKLLDGEPCLVISNGQILEKNMRKMRYTLDDLMEELRKKEVFSVADVQFAVLETDGQISIQLKPEKKPVERQDMLLSVPVQTMPIQLIMDGRVIDQNLKQKNLTETWLMDQLKQRGIKDVSQVVYACLGTDQKLYIDIKQDH